MIDPATAFRATIPVLLGLAACANGSDTPTIEGKWMIASATVGGKEMPVTGLQGGALMLNAGSYIFLNDTGQYTLTPGSPATLQVTGERGPNAGRVIPAIVKVENDTLVICYDLSGKTPPKDFISQEGTQEFLARFTRAP